MKKIEAKKTGLKIDGKLFKGHYYLDISGNGVPQNTIKFYNQSYDRLPLENTIDNSNVMRDYFEDEHINIYPGSDLHNDIIKIMGYRI